MFEENTKLFIHYLFYTQGDVKDKSGPQLNLFYAWVCYFSFWLSRCTNYKRFVSARLTNNEPYREYEIFIR